MKSPRLPNGIPTWAKNLWIDRMTGQALSVSSGRFVDSSGKVYGAMRDGIACFLSDWCDASIDYYKGVGGAHFHERAASALAMTTLDTATYHRYLDRLMPLPTGALVADIGAGDGRNVMPWLEKTDCKLVAADAVGEALGRLRSRIVASHPEWLDRVLFVECDARYLPFRSGAFARVVTVETLMYLNEDYLKGLRECARLLLSDGQLLVAERDREASLIARLLYFGGIDGLIDQAQDSSKAWDGSATRMVRSRAFTARELAEVVRSVNLEIIEELGISAISMLVSFVAQCHDGRTERLDALHEVLSNLGRFGAMRRSHVVVAQPRCDDGSSS